MNEKKCKSADLDPHVFENIVNNFETKLCVQFTYLVGRALDWYLGVASLSLIAVGVTVLWP